LLVGFYHARKGEDDLAIASVMRARDLYQRIAREQPAGFGLEVWTELARANLNLAFAHQTAGRYEPSLSFFREFLDIYGRLARENPGVADYASAILSGNAMLAYSLAGLDRFDEAVAVYEEVTASADRLQRDHPDRFDPRTGLAVLGASNNHAETLRRAVRLPEALAAADRGLRRFEVLPFGMLGPLALNYRADVALLRSTRGQILGDLGRREEAINALTESAAGFQALTTEEDYPPARRRFAETLLQLASQQATLGELAGAAESVRRAEEALPAETRASDFHASLHAVKAALAGPDREEANRQGDLAIAALRRIVAERSLPVSSLRFEPTFEAIRDRPDLQALLLDRAFPTEPFARER
jgi:tetratricopeptide (TPR) repeat protein